MTTATAIIDAYVVSRGYKIHYEVYGDGPPILLHHGFTRSGEDWKKHGYVDALAPNYRVITIDAIGHGKSDKPHEVSPYALPSRAADVVAVLDACGVDKVIYWGYSMGARTGFVVCHLFPERVAAFINGAAGARDPHKEDKSIHDRARAFFSENPLAEWEGLTQPGGGLNDYEQDYYALGACQLGLLEWRGVDPKTLTMPIFHQIGDQDRLYEKTMEAAAGTPNAEVHVFPGLNHLTCFQRSDLVLPEVLPFIAKHASKTAYKS
jgi:pimeloyl-ACP methyl ester carboxylesterase